MNGESLLAAWCVSLLETCQKSWLIIQSIWIQHDKTNHNKVLQCLTWSCEENPVILKVCVYGRTNFCFFYKMNSDDVLQGGGLFPEAAFQTSSDEVELRFSPVTCGVSRMYFSGPLKLHDGSCCGNSSIKWYIHHCNEYKFTFFSVFQSSLPFYWMSVCLFSFVKLLKWFIINSFTVLQFTCVNILEITSSR